MMSATGTLLVFGAPPLAALVEAVVAGSGCTVTRAEAPVEALGVLSNGGVRLAIVDLSESEPDGVETVVALRTLPPPVGNTPVLVIAQGTNGAPLRTCRAIGIDGAVTDPVTHDRLAPMIARHLPLGHKVTVSETAVFDPTPTNDLARALGTKATRDIVAAFLVDTADRLARLSVSHDTGEIAREAHSLKSAAATMGAIGLEIEARSLEAMALAGDIPDRPRHDRLTAELERFRRALDAQMGHGLA